MAKTLLTATTSATASDSLVTGKVGGTEKATFRCPLLAGVETATIQVKSIAGAFSDVYLEGAVVEINVTNTEVTVYGCGEYRVNKSATAAAVSVEVSSEGDI